jgi:hypothetical protein
MITTNNTVLTIKQKQILDGILLSDGGIYKVKQSITKAFIDNIKTNISFNYCPIYVRPAYITKKYRANESYILTSHCDTSLINDHKRWYPTHKKIIPKDLILTPLSVKYWFYGDGSTVQDNRKTNLVCLQLATNGFTWEDVEFLIERFKIDCDLTGFHISRATAGTPRIITYKTSLINKFFDYIEECTIDDFKYKWKRPFLIKGIDK